MNELDATLDSMSPEELRALEAEVDKKAVDTTTAYYYARGQKMARESYAEFQKTGTMSPALFVVKAAADNVQRAAEVSAALDKCSAEELAEIEAELDGRLLDKISEEIAGRYYEAGVKLARAMWPAMDKTALVVPAGGLAAAKKVVKPARQLAARTGTTARQVLMPGVQKPAAAVTSPGGGFGTQFGAFIEKHPLLTGVAAGVVGSKLLNR